LKNWQLIRNSFNSAFVTGESYIQLKSLTCLSSRAPRDAHPGVICLPSPDGDTAAGTQPMPAEPKKSLNDGSNDFWRFRDGSEE
jgi:hypothetical protein